jgi:hypothetical protein
MESLSRKCIRIVRQQMGTKIMFIVIWVVDGFHVVDLMTSQHSFNSQYFVSHIMAPMVVKVFPRWRIPRDKSYKQFTQG